MAARSLSNVTELHVSSNFSCDRRDDVSVYQWTGMRSHSPSTCSSDYPPISDRYVCVSLPALPPHAIVTCSRVNVL